MDSVIFIHSKGAGTKRRILHALYRQESRGELNCSASLAESANMSAVAMKKHIDRLVELGYVQKINPDGKPIFLRLTEKGDSVAEKTHHFSKLLS